MEVQEEVRELRGRSPKGRCCILSGSREVEAGLEVVVDSRSAESCEEMDDRDCEGWWRRRRERSSGRKEAWGEVDRLKPGMDLQWSLRVSDGLVFFAVDGKKHGKVQGVSRSFRRDRLDRRLPHKVFVPSALRRKEQEL